MQTPATTFTTGCTYTNFVLLKTGLRHRSEGPEIKGGGGSKLSKEWLSRWGESMRTVHFYNFKNVKTKACKAGRCMIEGKHSGTIAMNKTSIMIVHLYTFSSKIKFRLYTVQTHRDNE